MYIELWRLISLYQCIIHFAFNLIPNRSTMIISMVHTHAYIALCKKIQKLIRKGRVSIKRMKFSSNRIQFFYTLFIDRPDSVIPDSVLYTCNQYDDLRNFFTLSIYLLLSNSTSSEQIAEPDPFRFGSNFAHVFIWPKWEILKIFGLIDPLLPPWGLF